MLCRLFGAAQLATPTGWRPSTPSGSFRDTLFKQLEDAATNCKPSLTEQVSHLLCLKILRHLLCLKKLRHLLSLKTLRHLLCLKTLRHLLCLNPKPSPVPQNPKASPVPQNLGFAAGSPADLQLLSHLDDVMISHASTSLNK